MLEKGLKYILRFKSPPKLVDFKEKSELIVTIR